MLSYETSVVCRGHSTIDPMNEPWSKNLSGTAFLSGWWHDTFVDPEDCLTYDPQLSRTTGRILIPQSGAYRIVLNFENNADPWDDEIFARMERYRKAIKARYPHLTISAYLSQARILVREVSTSRRAVEWIGKLRKFAAPFDEISPSLYWNDGDDAAVPGTATGVSRIAYTMQRRIMRSWSTSISQGKPLSPCVWWLNKTTHAVVTREQFWDYQIGAARSASATRAVILWGDVASKAEQSLFDEKVRPLISRPAA